jgi:enoyl-CoA hydratase/carnithine racemase
MSDGIVHVRTDGALLELTLDRPEGGNAVSEPMRQTLLAALRAVDPDIRLVRLQAAGGAFCTGRVSPMPLAGAAVTAESLAQRVAQPALELYAAFRDCPAPVLAIVHGAAHGFGCALAVACDLAIAAEDAEFAVPEMARDIPPLLVMSAMLNRLPQKAVMRLVLARDTLNGREAAQIGLVSRAVKRTELAVAAAAWSDRLLAYSPVAARTVKRYWADAARSTPAEASDLASDLSAVALLTRYQ